MTTRWSKVIFLGKILVVILPAILLLVLIKKDLVLNGRVEFFTDFSKPTATITELFPADRVINTNDNIRKIIKEPVYFEVRLPQTFEQIEIELTYKSAKLSLLQLGLRILGEEDWNYYFKPFLNSFFDELSWFKIETNNSTLWQKEKIFLSFTSFAREINRLSGLAFYSFSDYQNVARAVEFFKTPKDFVLPEEVNYIVSNYQTPIKIENGFQVSKINFDLQNANVVNRKLRFAISAPELNNGEGELSIKSIKVVLIKKPLTTQELVAKAIKYFKERF